MISFFNDIEGREYSPWYPAIQYLGTKGFFGSYEAYPDKMLTEKLSETWLTNFKKLLNKEPTDPTSEAKKSRKSEKNDPSPVLTNTFVSRVGSILQASGFDPNIIHSLALKTDFLTSYHITRGDACRLIFDLTEPT